MITDYTKKIGFAICQGEHPPITIDWSQHYQSIDEIPVADWFQRYEARQQKKLNELKMKRNTPDSLMASFFDFYALNLLDFFAGEKTLNHSSRAERITNRYAEVTEELYQKIYRALTYSVVREFRHFREETYLPESISGKKTRKTERYKELEEMSNKIRIAFIRGYHDKAFLRTNECMITRYSGLSLMMIHEAFTKYYWCDKFGGRSWGKATALLLDLPRTTEQKQIWIDRVLDLQHNTGHILNKTDFYVLSQPKKCHRQFEPKKNKRSPLNYRRYAERISDLIRYSSPSVRKLAIANMNYIPPQIR